MVARVFARRTNDSPTDSLAFFDGPDMWEKRRFDKIMVNCVFTYDKARAEMLADEWSAFGPVEIGGPAYGTRGEEFTPGMFLREGIAITSRGCPNKCWFCSVWKRDGGIRELEIKPGHDIFDDNICATSEGHFDKVIEMLKTQKNISFKGGIEAKILKDRHINAFTNLRLASCGAFYFAYDTPDDQEPLTVAIKEMKKAGFTRRQLCCYCLIGGPKDTIEKATERLEYIIDIGAWPFAMGWRGEDGVRVEGFASLQREFSNAVIIGSKIKRQGD